MTNKEAAIWIVHLSEIYASRVGGNNQAREATAMAIAVLMNNDEINLEEDSYKELL